MKRGITIILILLLAINIASAVEFDMKTNFSMGETFMAKLSGNFLEQPAKNDVIFYRDGHVKVPIESDIAKINDEFYIYALLPETEGNYSIKIENVRYYQGSQLTEDDIVKNFSITSDLADFSVNPGFVITNDDFSVEVQNLQDQKITIKIKTEPLVNSSLTQNESKGFFASLFGDNTVEENSEGDSYVTLKSGEIEKIKFKLEDIESSALKTIELSTDNLKYDIPVYIFTNGSVKQKKRDFDFDPSALNFSISTDSNLSKIIYLFNSGDKDLENISLTVSDSLKPYVSFSPEKIDEIKKDQQVKVELDFNTDSDEKVIEGSLKAKESEKGLDDIYAYLPITINITNSYIPSGKEIENAGTKTCAELGGSICNQSEECSTQTVDAKDDKCCIGTCQAKTTSSTGQILGWFLIIAIIVFLVWFFWKKWRK